MLDAGDAGFHVLPSNGDLTAAEVELIDVDGQGASPGAKHWPQSQPITTILCLIDCPPSLNMLTLNGLVAADSVLIADAM